MLCWIPADFPIFSKELQKAFSLSYLLKIQMFIYLVLDIIPLYSTFQNSEIKKQGEHYHVTLPSSQLEKSEGKKNQFQRMKKSISIMKGSYFQEKSTFILTHTYLQIQARRTSAYRKDHSCGINEMGIFNEKIRTKHNCHQNK